MIGIGLGPSLRGAGSPVVGSRASYVLDGQPPAVLATLATARFFVLDWWLVQAYRLDGWEPLVVFDAARALDHLGDWWLGAAYRLDFRSPAVVLDASGDRTYLQGA